MFEAYLAEHGYGKVPHEPDLGVDKFPDYVIECDGQRCVVEVKEFAPRVQPVPDRTRVRLAGLRDAAQTDPRSAARGGAQVQAHGTAGLPLVVMLANPNGVLLDLSIESIIYSMYGDLTFSFPVSVETGGATEPGQFVAGRNGRYRANHQYVSAVGLLGCRSRRAEHVQELLAQQEELSPFEGFQLVHAADERGEIPDGKYHVVTLVRTASESAVPMPNQFFDGADDRIFALNEEMGAYVQARGPARS
jgi:hypothetical protein